MLKQNIKIALQQVWKHKFYSLIKILGFALGIATCFLITLYIQSEFSYNKFYPGAENIYRLVGEYNNDGKFEITADWPAPMATALTQEFPEVEKSGRLMFHELFYGAGNNEIRRTDQQENTYEEKFVYADQDILDIFSIPLIFGDRKTALSHPSTMVISKHIADKYFPNENPIGKTMILNDDQNKIYTINAVMQDFPANTHLQYNFLLTLSGHELWPKEQASWAASNYNIYVLLKDNSQINSLEKKFKILLKKYFTPALREEGQTDVDKLEKNSHFILQPITDIHLKSYTIDDGLSHGDIRVVRLFAIITLFILFIACFNFINLSTAKSAMRAKEVGIRKVVGSSRGELVKQFLTESILFSLISMVLAILFAFLLLPWFNIICNKNLFIPWREWWLFPLMIFVAIVIGLLTGLYPSFYLSAFKPINTLKGQLSHDNKNSGLRNILVVIQFTISIILIISALTVYNQTNFILNRKIGFDKEQIILLHGTNTLKTSLKNFKAELLKLPEVSNVSVSGYLPIDGTRRNENTFWKEGKTNQENGISAQKWSIDDRYIKTYGMKIVKGRNFSPEMPTDSQCAIINQALAKKFNMANPIGQRITNGAFTFQIIGVVEDFNFESMRTNIGGVCLCLANNPFITSIKIKNKDSKIALNEIDNLWKKFSPFQPIRYTFLDEGFSMMYADVERMGNMIVAFTILAVLIACLGLFALSAFLAEQKNKEIGIRKILGASIKNIFSLLAKDFFRLLVISIIIGIPIACLLMNKWLESFAYRTNISWEIIALATLMSIIIALATVSYQIIKVATTSSVKNLKNTGTL